MVNKLNSFVGSVYGLDFGNWVGFRYVIVNLCGGKGIIHFLPFVNYHSAKSVGFPVYL